LLQAARFTVALIAAKKLGPVTWGVWQLLYLILAYSSFIHLGVINGMNREIPVLNGSGDQKSVRLIRSVVLGSVLASSLMAGLVIFVFAFSIDAVPAAGPLRWMPMLLVVYLLHRYLEVYLRSDKLFGHVSLQQLFLAVVFPTIAIPLLIAQNLPGYIIGQSLAIFLTCLFITMSSPIRLRLRFNLAETIRLLKIGFPIMTAGILYALMMTVDRVIISTLLTMQQLGYYSLSILVMGSLTLIPMVVGQQIYPRMAEAWGRTSTCKELAPWIRRQIIMSIGLTAPMIVAAYIILPPIVQQFLVDYVPGITAMKITLVAPLFWGLTSAFGNFLNTVNKQTYLLLFQALAVCLNIILNVILIQLGLGITGVAIGTTTAFVMHSLLLTIFGKFVQKKVGQGELLNFSGSSQGFLNH
jgi:O-antigen/teichoic acid export membrane protein